MSEGLLFFIVGGIAVAAAIMMLISRNAVHSALFLVVNFACVAFLYLMLDAPFLAMIQIAVYAGAIMVLFLFVIMLLGAEDADKGPTRIPGYRYLALFGVVLAGAFLLIAGIGITSGQISFGESSSRQPYLRVVHAAPYAGAVDVYVDGLPFDKNIAFGAATDFKALTPGEHSIGLVVAGSLDAVATNTLTLEIDPDKAENTFSAVAYGGDNATSPEVTLIADNLETVEARKARLSIFNGYDQAITLVDAGSPFDEAETDPAKKDDKVILADIQPGALVELPLLAETQSLHSWELVAGDEIIVRLGNAEVYTLKRETAQLLLVTNERTSDGSLRPLALPLVNDGAPSFGGPSAIGKLLFSRFMLPFQLIAVLLLAAMIGAIVLTHREDFVPRRRDVRRRVMKPLTDVISGQLGHDVILPNDSPQLPDKQPEAAGD